MDDLTRGRVGCFVFLKFLVKGLGGLGVRVAKDINRHVRQELKFFWTAPLIIKNIFIVQSRTTKLLYSWFPEKGSHS